MRRITVDQVADGLLLARAVEDRLGRTLLSKGDRLLLRYRDKLREWGITELYVEGEESQALAPAAPVAPAAAAPEAAAVIRKVEARFAGIPPENAVMAGLKQLAIKHLSAPRAS